MLNPDTLPFQSDTTISEQRLTQSNSPPAENNEFIGPVIPKYWPEIQFTFSEENIFGVTFVPNERGRRLSILNSITREVPNLKQQLGNRSPLDTYEATVKQLQSKRKVHGEEKSRKDWCDIQAVCNTVWIELSKVAHPVVQAWEDLMFINEERKLKNQQILDGQSSLKKRVLNITEQDDIAEALLFTFMQSGIISACDAQIATLKQQK